MPTYPNLPGGFLYDLGRDGSVCTVRRTSGTVERSLTTADMDSLANWADSSKVVVNSLSSSVLVAQFPQPRTVTGIIASVYLQSYPGTFYVETSTDTTDGIDGTWVSAGSWANTEASDSKGTVRRNRLFPVGLSGIIAVRLRLSSGYSNTVYYRHFMVWGTTELEGLVPWHPTLDQALSNDNGLDRGDILVTAAATVQQFRVRNASTVTANNVVVAADGASDFGQLHTEVLFSLDDVQYQQSITIPSIAAGANSPVIYVKRPTPTDIVGTVRACTIRAAATTWS